MLPAASSRGGESSASNSAATLVEIAADWAVALGMSLTILNVAAPHVSLTGSAGNDELEQWMTDLAALAVRDQLAVDTHVEVDPVGTTNGIRSYLAAHPAGLLAMSTRARDGLDRLVHGATAADITAASTIATLVVPIPQQGAQP